MSSFGRNIHRCPICALESLVVHPHGGRPGFHPARNRSDTVGEIGSLVRGHCVGWLSCPEVAHVASPAAASPTGARRHRPYCPGRIPARQPLPSPLTFSCVTASAPCSTTLALLIS